MFRFGSFENSLRSSVRREHSSKREKQNDSRGKHKSCLGKAHAHCLRKNKPTIRKSTVGHRKAGDQCVPKSDESLNNMAADLDQKVPGSSREASIDDSIGLSESDNEKLKSNSDNYTDTRRKLNSANGFTFAPKKRQPGVQWTRSRSCDDIGSLRTGLTMANESKVLKIRGPFGSLVDLSDPFYRTPYSEYSEKIFDLRREFRHSGTELTNQSAAGKKWGVESEAKENQSYENLLKAINNLSKSAEDGDEISEKFESLEVEEFKSARVSHLFEVYYDVSKPEKLDKGNGSNIEELIGGLRNLNTSAEIDLQRRNNLQKSDSFRRSVIQKGKGNKVRNVGELSLEKMEAMRKNELLERKWKPVGVVKKSAPSSFTMERARFGCHKDPINVTKPNVTNLVGKSTTSIKLTITGKSNVEEAKTVDENSKKPLKGRKIGETTETHGHRKPGRTCNIGNNIRTNVHVLAEEEPDVCSPKSEKLNMISEVEDAKKRSSTNEIFQKTNDLSRRLRSLRNKTRLDPSKGEERSKEGNAGRLTVGNKQNQTLAEKLKSTIEEYVKKTEGIKLEIVEDFEKRNHNPGRQKTSKIERRTSDRRLEESVDKVNVEEKTPRKKRNVYVSYGKHETLDLPKTMSPGKGSVKRLISSFESNMAGAESHEFFKLKQKPSDGVVIEDRRCKKPMTVRIQYIGNTIAGRNVSTPEYPFPSIP